ncbi:thiamine-phosphate kinase [Evansella clarkii]|uniref:thiamine-phosphate kinase n=1 Tax=Evansella clarkii TaxID=79879 RepID=UPI000B440BE5|nr:thiamine-phosphate kinase [Evansella clarkii]
MNNEINWIRQIAPECHHQEGLKAGIGDDAAIYHLQESYETVVCVDTMVEGIHFKKTTMPMKAIGHKALAANISDLAAMGAVPLYYLVSVAVPKKGWSVHELNSIYEGMKQLGDQHKMDLIGGDTVSINENLVLTVTVIGKLEKGRRLLRSAAEPGDIFFTTGPLGNSAFGLEKLLEQGLSAAEQEEHLPFIKAHQYPVPQVKAGRVLSGTEARIALNDISDGLASEAKEIAEASKVNVTIDWDEIPRAQLLKAAPQDRQEEWVLYGGEDYQLAGTVGSENWDFLKAEFEKQSLQIYKIGFVTEGQGDVYLKKGGKSSPLTKTGYGHL